MLGVYPKPYGGNYYFGRRIFPTGNKTFTGITTVPAPINSRDAVNKTYVDGLKAQIENLQIQVGIQEIDGNYYAVIKIGTQLWMEENLKTKRYSNGDPIPTTTPFDKDIGGEVAT